MYVQHITVDEFKKKLDSIYRSTKLPSQFYSTHDTIKDIILKDLIREDRSECNRKIYGKTNKLVIDHFLFPKY
jgi:hypothetical protein